MNKNAIKYIVGGSIVLLGLIVCGIAVAMGGTQLVTDGFTVDLWGVHSYTGENTSVDFDVDGIKNITIETGCSDFEIITADTDKITVECSNIRKNLLSTSSSGDTVSIKYNTSVSFNWLSWTGCNGKIVVTIPENLELTDFRLVNSVGETTLKNITAKNVYLKNNVGTTTCTNIKADYADCRTDVGELLINDIECNKLDSDTGVGEARITGTINGNVSASNGVGSTRFEGVINGDIDIDNGVGEARFTLDGNEDDYNVKTDNGIGEINVDGSGGSDAKYKVNIKNGIGSVDFKVS